MSQISKKKFWNILKQKPEKKWDTRISDKDTPQSVWIAGYKRWRKMMDKIVTPQFWWDYITCGFMAQEFLRWIIL